MKHSPEDESIHTVQQLLIAGENSGFIEDYDREKFIGNLHEKHLKPEGQYNYNKTSA